MTSLMSYNGCGAFRPGVLAYEVACHVVARLMEQIRNKSRWTFEHSVAVGEASYQLSKAIGFDQDRANMLREAAKLHDIGKLSIPAKILDKPGPLSEDETAIIRNHVVLGSSAIRRYDSVFAELASNIALHHHERLDGRGYRHLKGDCIPDEIRIVSICDVFDALCARRPYQSSRKLASVLRLMSLRDGPFDGAFDPVILRRFVTIKLDGECSAFDAESFDVLSKFAQSESD